MSSSYTFTIESTGGNGIVVPGWGFLLNNELTDFNYDTLDAPERAARRQAAALLDGADHRQARRRPLLAMGSPGGATIITTVLQILRRPDGPRQALPAAIAAPRASQRNTATTQAEPAFIATVSG